MKGQLPTNQLHDINWGALDHAPRAPHMSVCVCVCLYHCAYECVCMCVQYTSRAPQLMSCQQA